MQLKNNLIPEKLPRHIAIIMDGNGRWALQREKARIFGHQEGIKTVRKIVDIASNLGIKHLTLYAFSKENWNRPNEEINALMTLLVKAILKEEKKLIDTNIRLNLIGDIESLPKKIVKNIQKILKETSHCNGLNLNLALSYSSRWEILEAIKKISVDLVQQKIAINKIDCELFSEYLTTKDIPDPDLLIRTSGEKRLSNFLLWQLAYTELYFTKKLWPDFDKEEFYKALYDFQSRERRFGLTGNQIQELERK